MPLLCKIKAHISRTEPWGLEKGWNVLETRELRYKVLGLRRGRDSQVRIVWTGVCASSCGCEGAWEVSVGDGMGSSTDWV